jgi:N-acetylglucosamine-6-phosphate deacetylase
MNEAIENCVEKCGLSLEQSLTMATLIPAQLLGVDDQIGRIAKGYRSDLIAMNLNNYSCQLV